MKEQEIENGNKLISLFMGGKLVGDGQVQLGNNPHKDRYYYLTPTNPGMKNPQYLQYNSSWDWLMPVCQRIAKWMLETRFDNKLKIDDAIEAWVPICKELEKIQPIEKVFPRVVQFIQWYNSQSTKPQTQL